MPPFATRQTGLESGFSEPFGMIKTFYARCVLTITDNLPYFNGAEAGISKKIKTFHFSSSQTVSFGVRYIAEALSAPAVREKPIEIRRNRS